MHQRFATLSQIFLTGVFSVSAQAEIITVGPTAEGCDQPTLALAFLRAAVTAESDTLLFATDQTHTGGLALALIDESPVTLSGINACNDASPRRRTITTTIGDLFEFDATAATIRGLDLEGDTGGRLLTATNFSLLTLEDTKVTLGRAVDGGNIHLSAGASLVAFDGTLISDGQASWDGGGIYCSGDGVVALAPGSRVRGNVAGRNGGGVYAGGCLLNLQSGASVGGAAVPFGIIFNEAGGDGGGVYAIGGGGVVIAGAASRPGSLNWNTAGGLGGGLYLAGSTTEALITDSQIHGNRGVEGGGGMMVTAEAELLMDRTLTSCNRGLRCSLLGGNEAGENALPGDGGALQVRGGGTATVRQTYFTDNSATAAGNVLFVTDSASSALVENSVLYDNHPGGTHVEARVSGLARLAFVSAWGSSTPTWPMAFARAAGGGDVDLYSSVIIEGQGSALGGGALPDALVDVAVGGDIDLDCVLAHEDPFGQFRVVALADPALVWQDPSSGDPHLRWASPALDFCDTVLYLPQDGDIDNEPRGTDVAALSDFLGPYDLGADEWSGATGPIFADGFESGDTAVWSSSAP